MVRGTTLTISTRRFVLLTYGVFLFVFIVLVAWLFRWQVLAHDRFVELANAQIKKKQKMQTKRGSIYSADGVVLASDLPTWDLVISVTNEQDKQKFFERENFSKFIKNLKEILNVPEDAFYKLQSQNLNYYIFAKNLTVEQKEAIEELHIPGLYLEQKTKRIYPNGTLASHVLGFVGKDVKGSPVGLYGIEGYFWGDLKGKKGQTLSEKSIGGNTLVSNEYRHAVVREGKNIVLTIRSGIQKKVEKILAYKVKEYGAKSGSVIIMDPHTGEILVMANYPSFDPNKYWEAKDVNIFKNKAVASVYEYGSVQKPLTLAIALQEDKIKKDYKCYDSGRLKVLDKIIYNWSYAQYGWLTLEGILEHSDNVCAATIGLKVGAKNMYTYLHKLGIGQLLHVGLQDEETGYLKDYKKWNKVDIAVSAFGQMVSATPLQVTSAMSALANSGNRMQPFLVKEIYNSEETINFKPFVANKVFDKDVADYVAKIMYKATMKQSSWYKYRGIYSIAGKTGTAQIAKSSGNGYEEDKTNVTFVGFVPYDNPVMIMLVRLEEPKKYQLASQTAVPTWQAIFDAIKDDLGIPRNSR